MLLLSVGLRVMAPAPAGPAAVGSALEIRVPDSPVWGSRKDHEGDLDDQEEKKRRGNLCHRTILDPRTNSFVAYWDLVATLALLYTAVVTPFEVSFMTPVPFPARWTSTLFLINRSVDAIFIFDMLLQFRMVYKTENVREGTRWVNDGRLIARHYLCSVWFPIDLFSVSTLLFDVTDTGGANDLMALKTLRTLRLVKLVKLARGSRILKRWEMHLSINYSYLTLASVMTAILISCHWTACIWGLQATFDMLGAWPGAKGFCIPWGDADLAVATTMLEDCTPERVCTLGDCDQATGVCQAETANVGGEPVTYYGTECLGAYEMYIYSLYFAIMTITSVGFGDVSASAFNVAEQIIASLIMLISGMLWGYLIGVFCTMAAATPSVQAFRDEMSELNSFMSAYNLSPSLRFRLREYAAASMRKPTHPATPPLPPHTHTRTTCDMYVCGGRPRL